MLSGTEKLSENKSSERGKHFKDQIESFYLYKVSILIDFWLH